MEQLATLHPRIRPSELVGLGPNAGGSEVLWD